MKKNNVRKLPKNQEIAILSFIKEKNLEEKGFFNKILRDDIFHLLESQDCIVLYYPQENEENNGFHVNHPFRGKLKKFVYINTAQLKETQIFAAAHELGHIWGVVEYMKEKGFSSENIEDWDEWIINRFAAELLMPVNEFHQVCKRELDIVEEQYKHNQMPMKYAISVITAIMNEFFTPYKSVVHRFYELGVISNETAFMLLDEYDSGLLRDYSEKIAKEQGYSRLFQPADKLKHIDGLKEFLDKAKETDAMPEKWLFSMYKLFDFDYDTTIEKSLTENIDILKGGSVNAEDGGH